MRTTLDLDDDVLDRARSVAERLRAPFRQVVNEALRAGLRTMQKPAISRPYHTKPHGMGLRTGTSLDNIQDLLARIETKDHQ